MTSAMQGLICAEFTAEEFEVYCKQTLPILMKDWHPEGIVLHNTGPMAWPRLDPNTHQPLTTRQYVENMSVTWVANGFKGGPHLLITPKPSIVAMWPLWEAGTHSPSFNASYWGIETMGDFDLQPLPTAMRACLVRAARALFGVIGRAADDHRLKYHNEDPRTTHKHCPGKNFGPKSKWIEEANASNDSIASIDLSHARPVPAGANEFIRAREGRVLTAYKDNLVFSIGYGTHIKPDGSAVQEGEVCTEAQAIAWQEARTQSDWDHVQQLVKVPITNGQATAILSWCYQFSVGKFATTTFLQKLNERDYAGAAASFMTWDKVHDATGALVESAGIKKRRMLEIALWNGSTIGATPVPKTPVPFPPRMEKPVPLPQAPMIVTTMHSIPKISFWQWILSFLKPRQAALGTTSNKKGVNMLEGQKTNLVSVAGLATVAAVSATSGLSAILSYAPAIVAVLLPLLAMTLRSAIKSFHVETQAAIAEKVLAELRKQGWEPISEIAGTADDILAKALANDSSK